MISFLILIYFRAIKRVTRLLEGKKRYWKQHWYDVRALEKGNTTQNRAAMRFGTITKFINSHREPKGSANLLIRHYKGKKRYYASMTVMIATCMARVPSNGFQPANFGRCGQTYVKYIPKFLNNWHESIVFANKTINPILFFVPLQMNKPY